MIELEFRTKVLPEYEDVILKVIHEVESEVSIASLLCQLKDFDKGTYEHSVSVATFSLCTGLAFKIPYDMLKLLTAASLLHDIGKLEIPKEILCKPSELTTTEFSVIKQHPCTGAKIARGIGLSDTVIAGIQEHHEKMNGGGYPLNLKSEAIHPFARIIAIADVFDAVISERPYHQSNLPIVPIQLLADSNDFDKKFVYAFFSAIVPYPERIKLVESNK